MKSAWRPFTILIAVLAALLGGGCGDRDAGQITAEIDDPFYVQGLQLKKQGRNSEALTAFLKVIDRRGERGAAESHLDAGVIYLHHIKDPITACYHFRKYLELQPNSREAPRVRGMVDAAKREFAKTIPGRPLEEHALRMPAEDELKKLQKENEELRAMLATLRGGEAMPVSRSARTVTLPEDPRPRVVPPVTSVADAGGMVPAPLSRATESPIQPAPVAAAPARTARNQAPPAPTPAVASRQPPPPTTTRTVPPAAVPAGGRTHTVAPKETLYGISTRYYGHGRNVEAIYQANRDLMRNPTDVKIGMKLRIP